MTTCTCEHIHSNRSSSLEGLSVFSRSKRYDPTWTTQLRNLFAREMTRRFTSLARQIRSKIVDEDCFGLQEPKLFATRATFAFRSSQDKVNAFMDWLQNQVNLGILDIKNYEQIGFAANQAWTNMYIADSYKRGVIRARYELPKADFKGIPTLEESGGVEMLMSNPFHVDRLGLLYSRVFTDLKGITDSMDQMISRVLTQGIADGDNPRFLARKLVKVVTGAGEDISLTDSLGRFIPAQRRAETLARTEIIRAHHQATIQEYRNWGVSGVKVIVEWQTAGDDRVCSRCADLSGRIYTLDEIQGMIPLHPNCRCVAIPSRTVIASSPILEIPQKEKKVVKASSKGSDQKI